ncbi:MAG: right-handed parallel beta-helix repeat-containing protein, partial [Deltaproteobacteria bacterium]|nr:right-handed parallel beta-helix repeat-containing protein [Deltaproteobacteria bacterium]
HLAGRCRELVTLDGSDELYEVGIFFWGSSVLDAVTVSGITLANCTSVGIQVIIGRLSIYQSTLIHNAVAGVFAEGAEAELVMEDVHVVDTQSVGSGMWGVGIGVHDGASLFANRCVVEGNTEAGISLFGAGSYAHLIDVEVRDNVANAKGEFGTGIEVIGGSDLVAESCLVENNTTAGVVAEGVGSRIELTDVRVLKTQPNRDGHLGNGIGIYYGATAHLSSCVLEDNGSIGLQALDPGTTITVEDTRISSTHRSSLGTTGFGVSACSAGHIEATRLVVEATEGPGVFAGLGGTLVCTECELLDNAFAGAVNWGGATLELYDSTISGTVPDANEGGGAGVYATGFAGPATVRVENTLITEHRFASVWLTHDGVYSLRGNTFLGGAREELYPGVYVHGDAIVARNGVTRWNGSQGLLLEDNVFRDSDGAGVFLDASSATLTGNTFTDNAVDLVQQTCDGIDLPLGFEEAAVTEFCPDYNHLVVPLDFDLYMDDEVPYE